MKRRNINTCVTRSLKNCSNLLYRSGMLLATTAQNLAKLHAFAYHLYAVALNVSYCTVERFVILSVILSQSFRSIHTI